jgi:cardiolipin synthase
MIAVLDPHRDLRLVERRDLRTHRKIGVFDGRIAYIGGHGIAQEWTGNAEDREHWRDTFVQMEGPVATTVQGVFCENWIEETGRVPAGPKYFPDLHPIGETDAHVAFASPRDSISTVQLVEFDEWRTRPWSHKLLDGFGFLMRREL